MANSPWWLSGSRKDVTVSAWRTYGFRRLNAHAHDGYLKKKKNTSTEDLLYYIYICLLLKSKTILIMSETKIFNWNWILYAKIWIWYPVSYIRLKSSQHSTMEKLMFQCLFILSAKKCRSLLFWIIKSGFLWLLGKRAIWKIYERLYLLIGFVIQVSVFVFL